MEADKSPMPHFDLFPRLERAARFVGKALQHITSAPDHMSDHYRASCEADTQYLGGAAMLDRELYDNQQLVLFHSDMGDTTIRTDHHELA